MKKAIIFLSIFVILFGITGCGKKKDNNQTNTKNTAGNQYISETEEYEVFSEIDDELLNTGILNNQTFFYLIYDDSFSSKALKEDIEKIAKKYEYNIYFYNLNEAYEKELKEKNDILEKEQQDFINTYCKLVIIPSEELSNYDSSEIVKDKDSNFGYYRCSNEIAKTINPDYNYSETDSEPLYECKICDKLKNELSGKMRSDFSTNLIFIKDGEKISETGNYLDDEYLYLTKAERKEYKTKSYNALEKWFELMLEYTK